MGTPGLILEHSFHTNEDIARWLLNPDNLKRLAKAETAAIILYYNINQPIPENRFGTTGIKTGKTGTGLTEPE